MMPAWQCFSCEGPFEYSPGFCSCGVELRRVPILTEA